MEEEIKLRDPKDVKIGRKTLYDLLESHRAWMYDYSDAETNYKKKRMILSAFGKRKAIDLTNVAFTEYYSTFAIHGAIFENVNFSGSVFSNIATFSNATFSNCNFDGCDLSNMVFNMTVFRMCSFENTNLSGTRFRSGTSFIYCTFENADLSKIIDGNFNNCGFHYCDFTPDDGNMNTVFSSTCIINNPKNLVHSINCPSDGSFIGWKVIKSETKNSFSEAITLRKYLIKLEIPEDAKRSSALNAKCRSSKAKVLGIYDFDTGELLDIKSVTNKYVDLSLHSPTIIAVEYTVGEYAYPDSFDEDRWNVCSHGIHFFINKEDAILYGKNILL